LQDSQSATLGKERAMQTASQIASGKKHAMHTASHFASGTRLAPCKGCANTTCSG